MFIIQIVFFRIPSPQTDSLVNENNESFNFGYKDGVRGFFTNPSRADDSFIPFNSGEFEGAFCFALRVSANYNIAYTDINCKGYNNLKIVLNSLPKESTIIFKILANEKELLSETVLGTYNVDISNYDVIQIYAVATGVANGYVSGTYTVY